MNDPAGDATEDQAAGAKPDAGESAESPPPATPGASGLPRGREIGLTLRDAVAEVRWFAVARTAAFAMRPERLAFGALPAAVMAGAAAIAAGGGSARGPAWVFTGWWASVSAGPLTAAASALAAFVALAFASVAIARSVAFEHGLGLRIGVVQTASFAARRLLATAGGLLVPPALAAIVALPAAAVAAALLVAGPVSGVGTALLGPALLLGFGAAALLAGWAVAALFAGPAAACDGADVFDSALRGLSYTAARPGFALFLLGASALIGVLLLAALAGLWGATFAGLRALAGLVAGADDARAALNAWAWLPGFTLAAAAISFANTAGTVVYLVLREALDGQTPAWIWAPGDPAGATRPEHL